MSTFTPAQVVAATGCPLHNVSVHLPQVQAALEEFGIASPLVEAALCATIAVETAHAFWPVAERWALGETMEAYFTRMYAPPAHVAAMLGNRDADDAILYRGRGDIQVTGRTNYAACGVALNLPLLATPEKLLDPVVSARAAAWFFAKHGHRDAQQHFGRIPQLCAERDWLAVREAVNGGVNGYSDFKGGLDGLLVAAGLAAPPSIGNASSSA